MSLKFALICCILVIWGRRSSGNKCATDPRYSYRVCSALTTFIKNRGQCDAKELHRLRQRVKFLQGILSALSRESNSLKNQRRQSKNCRNAVEYENACYFLLDENGPESMRSYSQAENACRSKQAKLATMENQPTYDFLYTYVTKNAKDFVKKARNLVLIWTGASYRPTDGSIVLENNRTTDFSMWSNYHPLNETERNKIAVAVATNPQVRGMFDAMPSLKLYPLCKKSFKSKKVAS